MHDAVDAPAARARRSGRGRCTSSALTRSPASWQRSIMSAVTVGSHGCTAVWPRRDAARPACRRRRSSVSHAVGTSGATQAAAVDGLQPERRDQPPPGAALGERGRAPRRRRGRRGRSRARARSFLISMLTHAPAHASSASPSVGTCVGQVPPTASRRSPVRRAARASWWTTSTPSAVRRTSSSTPSAPSATASSNAAIVFSGASRDAPRWAMTSVTPERYPLSSHDPWPRFPPRRDGPSRARPITAGRRRPP